MNSRKFCVWIGLILCLNLSALFGEAMEYFSFEIDGKKVGYYVQQDLNGTFFCNAWMEMGGERFENPFWVRHQDGKILAYKFGDGEYIDFKYAEGVYPTSAFYLLVIWMGEKQEFRYKVLNEGQGKITGEALLKREGMRVQEFIGDQPGRYLILKQGKVQEFGWGGSATSIRVASEEEARKDTPFEQKP